MSNEYPRMLYKAGGPEEINGRRFSTLIVNSQDEQDAAQEDGWHLTTTEASAPKVETKTYSDGTTVTGAAPLPDQSPEQQDASDNAPPTRAELEQKAKELGIKFDGRTSDKKLGELIATELEK